MSVKQKAIFLDKDGTIIPDIPYNVDAELITLHEGVAEGLLLLQRLGYIFIVISNQAGVARGYFKHEDLNAVSTRINSLLNVHDIFIKKYYYCPHHPEGKIPAYTRKCNCRKPAPGMLLSAIAEFNIDENASWMIGDTLNDVEAGNRAGCQTVFINNGKEADWKTGEYRTPTFIASNFSEAATYIHDLSASVADK